MEQRSHKIAEDALESVDAITSVGPRITFYHAHDGLAVAEVGTVSVLLWRATVTPARFAVQQVAIERITARYPKKATLFVVIEPGADPPSEDLRRRASQMLTAHAPHIRGMACVIEGGGFAAAMMRGVLSSIELLMGGYAFPTRYFAKPADGAHWIAKNSTVAVTPLVETVAVLRSLLDESEAPRGSARLRSGFV